MNFISEIFGSIFEWINTFTHNYGLSIILFTILFRLVLLPFDIRSRVGQREYTAKMKKIQPEMDMINKAYKNDPQKAQQMMMEIRKREGIGMMPKGCGTMLLTYPILIAFFAVFRNIAAEKMVELSTLTDAAMIEQWFDTNSFLWVKNIWQPDVYFNFSKVWGMRVFWIIKDINGPIVPETVEQLKSILKSAFDGGFLDAFNAQSLDFNAFCEQVNAGLQLAREQIATGHAWLGGNGLYIFPVLSGVVQILSFNLSSAQQQQGNDPAAQQAQKTGNFMKIFFPILFVYFCLVSSTALAVYWTTSSLCMILVNYLINKVLDARDKKKLKLEGEK